VAARQVIDLEAVVQYGPDDCRAEGHVAEIVLHEYLEQIVLLDDALKG
jgi:hypothetical protein